MFRRKIRNITLMLALVMTVLSGAAAYANVTITLPQAEGAEQTVDKILSVMQTGGFNETDEFKKQYADCYAGMNAAKTPVTVYTTDKGADAVKQLASNPNIEIREVRYSLNRLNGIASEVAELGRSGRIDGYSGAPYVDVDGNRVVLFLENKDDSASPLSDEDVLRMVNADEQMLYFNHTRQYSTGAVEVDIPKTGDMPIPLIRMIAALAVSVRLLLIMRTGQRT